MSDPKVLKKKGWRGRCSAPPSTSGKQILAEMVIIFMITKMLIETKDNNDFNNNDNGVDNIDSKKKNIKSEGEQQ